MVQWHSRASDFVYECLAARLNLIQIRRSERRVGRAGKNQVCDFEIAHRPAVRCSRSVDFLGNTQRRFAHFVIRPNVADQRRINSIGENDQCVVSHFTGVAVMREAARDDDVRVGRADQETEFPERADFKA